MSFLQQTSRVLSQDPVLLTRQRFAGATCWRLEGRSGFLLCPPLIVSFLPSSVFCLHLPEACSQEQLSSFTFAARRPRDFSKMIQRSRGRPRCTGTTHLCSLEPVPLWVYYIPGNLFAGTGAYYAAGQRSHIFLCVCVCVYACVCVCLAFTLYPFVLKTKPKQFALTTVCCLGCDWVVTHLQFNL